MKIKQPKERISLTTILISMFVGTVFGEQFSLIAVEITGLMLVFYVGFLAIDYIKGELKE